MPLPNLAPEEYAEIVRLVRAAIDGDRYHLSPRSKRLKSILAKLDPAAERPTAIPFYFSANTLRLRCDFLGR